MFETVYRATGQVKRLEEMRMVLTEAIRDKRAPVFYTVLLQLEEPHRTHALMALDGHQLNGGLPPVVVSENVLPLPDVRLVTRSKHQEIKYKETRTVRVPGTDRNKVETVIKSVGNDAMVPHRTARAILKKHGWPIVDQNSNGNRSGYVVEYDWLAHEVTQKDCRPEFKDIWKELQDRQPQNARKAQ